MVEFANKRLSVHHVGGRPGSRAFPVLARFEKDVINILYDADTDCLAQVEERNRKFESELHVLPYCLGDSCRTGSLNINYDPFTSSLRDANPVYESFYQFYHTHDYPFSETVKTIEKRACGTGQLRLLFPIQKFSRFHRPDFLSIDTQGSEYEILQGAKDTLRSSVLALIVEVEFHPLYQGQRLFGDLSTLLSDQGFSFVRLSQLDNYLPIEHRLGSGAKGFTHLVMPCFSGG